MPRDGAAPPQAPAQRPQEKSGASYAALIGAAVLVVLPVTAGQEGFVPKAAPDPAHIPTAMFGETQGIDPNRIYTRAEGMERLRARLARDYAPKILACVSAFREPSRKRMFAAFIDASYNAGPAAVCRSPMAVRARAGQLRAACAAFTGWYVTARDRRTGKRIALPGLVKRRRDVERPLCLSGLAADATEGVSAAHSTLTSDGWPPPRFALNPRDLAQVRFTDQTGIEAECGKASRGRMEACEHGPRLTMPNPCTYPADDNYARLLCHEIGHLNGWPETHGD